MEPRQTEPLIITRVRDQARSTRSFDLRPIGINETQGVSFIPGQVAILQVEGEAPSYFAFASAPEDTELEVLVKQKVGVSNVIFEMQEGQTIDLVGIAGHGFPLEAQRNRDLVFVAMGTGVAPRAEAEERLRSTSCALRSAHARRFLLSRRNRKLGRCGR